jgi:hypothetical protein
MALALGLTQPLTEMNSRNIPGAKGQLAGTKVRQPHRHMQAECLENVTASMSRNLMGLHCWLQGQV